MPEALQAFHFLRPWWLLGPLPALVLTALWARRRWAGTPWRNAVAPNLLDVLLEDGAAQGDAGHLAGGAGAAAGRAGAGRPNLGTPAAAGGAAQRWLGDPVRPVVVHVRPRPRPFPPQPSPTQDHRCAATQNRRVHSPGGLCRGCPCGHPFDGRCTHHRKPADGAEPGHDAGARQQPGRSHGLGRGVVQKRRPGKGPHPDGH